jgi:predicted phage baseplate assembly protein
MFLPARTLDDRRWTDLIEEARTLIPLHAPEWTDHNASDPGITFAELFAWLAEMEIFATDQVPARHRRKFLALVGLSPAAPRPARTVLRFSVPAGTAPVALPATLECTGPADERYRTLHALRVIEAAVDTLTSPSGDVTDRWRRGEPVAPLGEDPRAGDAFVIALSSALPRGVPVSLAVTVPPPGAGEQPEAGPEHHSAHIAWELQTAPGRWRRLDAFDDTAALTRDGRVVVVAPVTVAGPAYRLRAVLVHGTYDATPMLTDVALNGVAAEQSVPPASLEWEIAAGAPVVGIPAAGRRARIQVERDADGVLTRLDVTDASAPALLVLDYLAPRTSEKGRLTVEATDLGTSDGSPDQLVALPDAPVDAESVRLWTLEGTGTTTTWRRWALRPDLDASGAADAHVVLDPAPGTLGFGDGAHGLVPPTGAQLVAAHRATRADAAAAIRGTIDRVADSAHNAAVLARRPPAVLPAVMNPVPATGGAAAETLEHAEGRASVAAALTTRAVTLADYERLARATPGVRLARASARANVHPGFACVGAVGVITVIVVPHLPLDRPVPSAATRRAVARQLGDYRIVGTRVEVTAPTYVCVAVRARVRPQARADTTQLPARVAAALDAFLHPLHGGPAGTGWPFGRDVVRSEILQVIDDVPGVDHVLELELVGCDGPSCGDLCLGPLDLVAAGEHTIALAAS